MNRKHQAEWFSGDAEMARLMGQIAEHVEAIPVAIVLLHPDGHVSVAAPGKFQIAQLLVQALEATLRAEGEPR